MSNKIDITGVLQERGFIDKNSVVKKINFSSRKGEKIELECIENTYNKDPLTGETYIEEIDFITNITWNEFEDLF